MLSDQVDELFALIQDAIKAHVTSELGYVLVMLFLQKVDQGLVRDIEMLLAVHLRAERPFFVDAASPSISGSPISHLIPKTGRELHLLSGQIRQELVLVNWQLDIPNHDCLPLFVRALFLVQRIVRVLVALVDVHQLLYDFFGFALL